MIRLEVFGESGAMAAVAQLLDENDEVSSRPAHQRDAARSTPSSLATVHPRAVDELLDNLRRLGVPEADVTLTRVEVLGRSSGQGAEAGLVWEDVLGMAARTRGRSRATSRSCSWPA